MQHGPGWFAARVAGPMTAAQVGDEVTTTDEGYYPVARLVRCSIIGSMFGVCLGAMTPISPLFRRTFQQDKMGHRVALHAASASFLAAGGAYARYIDWGTNDPSWFP